MSGYVASGQFGLCALWWEKKIRAERIWIGSDVTDVMKTRCSSCAMGFIFGLPDKNAQQINGLHLKMVGLSCQGY